MRELRIYEDPSEICKNFDYHNTVVNGKIRSPYYTKKLQKTNFDKKILIP